MTQLPNTAAPAHQRAEFHFTLKSRYEDAAPLFGAWAERKWAAGWDPRFLHPDPPADREGAVFRVRYPDGGESVWITTVFDLPNGRVQYVSALDGVIITKIDIRLAAHGQLQTEVSVSYERTALDPAANPRVLALSRQDASSGPEWKSEIEAALG